tara:strand:+ start:846 stop:1109 length:264 start_codon:yes stop_codon:yes gene_type:complete
MKYIILIFLLVIFLLLRFNYRKKLFGRKKEFKLNKKNLYTWMNFSKKKRYDLLKKESKSYLDHRKNLLNQIRQEYESVSNANKKDLS